MTFDLKPYKEAVERREKMHFVAVELTLSSLKELIAAVETLQERVIKLDGWLGEHESAIARARREINDANRKA